MFINSGMGDKQFGCQNRSIPNDLLRNGVCVEQRYKGKLGDVPVRDSCERKKMSGRSCSGRCAGEIVL
jgi:hypothetical protein